MHDLTAGSWLQFTPNFAPFSMTTLTFLNFLGFPGDCLGPTLLIVSRDNYSDW